MIESLWIVFYNCSNLNVSKEVLDFISDEYRYLKEGFSYYVGVFEEMMFFLRYYRRIYLDIFSEC